MNLSPYQVKRLFLVLAIILVGLYTHLFIPKNTSTTKPVEVTHEATSTASLIATGSATSRVARVIDGDTIELTTGQKVRYIGIDTPETVDPRRPVMCYGREASAENKRLVEGKEVHLEKDVSETDKYGRLLRYVYLDNLFINDYLVRQGFAHASTFPPDVKFATQFITAQKEARDNNRGLWAGCPR